jgi:hypothetical protein
MSGYGVAPVANAVRGVMGFLTLGERAMLRRI